MYLIRNQEKGGPGGPVRISLKNIIKKADFTQNYVLKSGDILYVARTGIADSAREPRLQRSMDILVP